MAQSSAADWGPILQLTRIAGTQGAAWLRGDEVHVAGPEGERTVEVPDDLRLPPPVPPDGDLMVTAYDLLHSTGIDLAPYTRLCEAFRHLIEGRQVPSDPVPATFRDGVANMAVLDAIRRSAAERRVVEVAEVA